MEAAAARGVRVFIHGRHHLHERCASSVVEGFFSFVVCAGFVCAAIILPRVSYLSHPDRLLHFQVRI
jgi:hypothetical protein